MIPLVGIKKEVVDQERQVRSIAEDVFRFDAGIEAAGMDAAALG